MISGSLASLDVCAVPKYPRTRMTPSVGIGAGAVGIVEVLRIYALYENYIFRADQNCSWIPI